jgi:Ca-activated chloride channel family protein
MKYSFSIAFKTLLFFGLWLVFYNVSAQQAQVYKPSVSRILFVLDGSGSMKQDWNGKTKFNTAKELLFKMIDSVERKNPNVEFAVRVFGYQFPREQRNCKDSKLVMPFARNNAQSINAKLNELKPQGMSPIAYSIQQGAKDFPNDAKSLNSIILITDGEENCDGNPCSAAKELVAKKITLKPFIVGLNVDSSRYEKFNCIGTFYDAKDESSLYNTVGVIIRQTLNTTTAQVNLLDHTQQPTITNIPFTLYDHYSGKVQYNFIHTLNEKGNPDTLFLDPVGVYDLEVHTFPSVRKEDIELTPGKHNIIALDVPVGDLAVECYGASDAQAVVRPVNGKQKGITAESILHVQNINEPVSYLANNYQLEILTAPEFLVDTTVSATATTAHRMKGYGTLSLMATEVLQLSIYREHNGRLQMIDRFEMSNKTENRRLQPGEYRIVYKPKSSYSSESTRSLLFKLEDGKTEVINLQ